MSAVRIAAVIPARMASSRFPRKPLLSIRGLPMVEHVRRRTLLCEGFSDVVVATCDEEIASVIRGHGGRVIMTSPAHPGATDRVAEAARSLDCTHVVNVQGDEVLVLPEDLDAMVEAIRKDPAVPAWNAVATLEDAGMLSDRSIVKCAVSKSGRILYSTRDFSKIPLKPPFDPIRMILGILGFERGFLDRYNTLERTPGEKAESIDQNRTVEQDVELRSVLFSRAYPGINEPREVALVESFLREDARQKAVLSRTLSTVPGSR